MIRVARRLALALPPLPSLRLARPARRLASLRALAVGAAVAASLALAYVGARETGVFALRTVEVSPAPPRVSRDVRSALDDLVGTSLLAIDAQQVERRLRALPSVRSARADRAFPHSLSVVVVPERPLAVALLEREAWLVSRRGRVIRRLPDRSRSKLPRIRLPASVTPRAGRTLSDRRAQLALRALADVPPRFPLRVAAARVDEGGAVLFLTGRIELRLGPAPYRLKLVAAEAVLRSLPPPARARLAYLDVSLPQRPVAADKSRP